MCDLPSPDFELTFINSILDKSLFLISSYNLWFGDILTYLQTQTFQSDTSHCKKQHIQYQAKNYILTVDTIYRHIIDMILRRCITYEEVKKVLNDATQGHVVVICLVMLPRRRSYVLVTFGIPFLEIVLLLSRSVMHTKFMIVRLVLHLLHASHYLHWNFYKIGYRLHEI